MQKFLRYGTRRIFVVILVKLILKVKVFYWRFLLSDNSPVGNLRGLLQPTQFIGQGSINIDGSNLGVWPSPGLLTSISYIEARNMTASITIGCETFINNSSIIIADKTKIEIGKRCMIGPNFFATDSDFHGLALKNRSNNVYECFPVIIGDDVFIGAGVMIMKGVTIGSGAVVGSGSIVVKDVEPNAIYAGVPAKFIKSIPSN